MNSPIEIINYDKLVDELYHLGAGFTLKFNVVLNKKNENGTRRHFHNEYGYNSNKYTDVNTMYTVKRAFDFYLSIENSNKENNTFIQIRVQDIMKVRYGLSQAYKWFDMNSDIFAIDKEGKLQLIAGNANPIEIGRLTGDTGIVIQPIVLNYDNISYEGVRIFLNRQDNYVDMTVDKFSGLLYLLSTIDMYQSAQLLINYNGRPDYGQNLFKFESSGNAIGEERRSQTITNAPKSRTKQRRFIPGTQKNDIDNL